MPPRRVFRHKWRDSTITSMPTHYLVTCHVKKESKHTAQNLNHGKCYSEKRRGGILFRQSNPASYATNATFDKHWQILNEKKNENAMYI